MDEKIHIAVETDQYDIIPSAVHNHGRFIECLSKRMYQRASEGDRGAIKFLQGKVQFSRGTLLSALIAEDRSVLDVVLGATPRLHLTAEDAETLFQKSCFHDRAEVLTTYSSEIQLFLQWSLAKHTLDHEAPQCLQFLIRGIGMKAILDNLNPYCDGPPDEVTFLMIMGAAKTVL